MRVVGLVNGRIYVSYRPLRRAEGLVFSSGRILYVGSSEKAGDIARSLGGVVRDLEGRVVTPGFIDVHMHADGLGLALRSLDLRGVRSIAELRERLRKYYEEHGEASWIIGRGWDQELFAEKRWPTRWDLDDIVPDKPVLLVRVCGHAAVANTKALEAAGLLENPPRDSVFKRDEGGRLTGLVVEHGVGYLRSKVEFTDEEIEEMLEEAMMHAASLGVTTLGFVSCSPRMLGLLEKIRLRLGRLPVRIRVYLSKDAVEPLLKLGLGRGLGGPYLKIMGVKLFTDGSLGARTALLSEPYEDDPATSGVAAVGEEELESLVERISRAGLQLAVHAIGDKAVDMVLKAYSKLGEGAVRKMRHRVEHASILRPEQVKFMAELGAAAAVQPRFAVSDWWAVQRLGERRAAWIYPFKTMLKAGIPLGFSTDAPVEPLNPWETIYAAITRGEAEGVELASLTPREKLEADEALDAYTRGSAYLLHEEDMVGELRPGMYADLVVLDKDPFEADVKELRRIKVLETVVGGETVYRVNG